MGGGFCLELGISGSPQSQSIQVVACLQVGPSGGRQFRGTGVPALGVHGSIPGPVSCLACWRQGPLPQTNARAGVPGGELEGLSCSWLLFVVWHLQVLVHYFRWKLRDLWWLCLADELTACCSVAHGRPYTPRSGGRFLVPCLPLLPVRFMHCQKRRR